MKQLGTIARWDKLKSWKVLSNEIDDKLKTAEKFDHGMTLEIGPQLLYTLRHPSALRCIEHTSSKLGEIFTCHYNKGAVQGLRVWLVECNDKDGACKNKGFETDCEITCMTYVSKHRVYLVFCSDLTLRVFTDAHSNFVEIDSVQCMSTILCLIYNKEDDEVYAGGIGIIEEWKVVGAEHAASVVAGKKFFTDLTKNDWIRDIKITKENNHIIAQHGNGLCVIHFKTRRQMHRLPNRHDGPLTCCCYQPQNDFLITGGSDGQIRVFNGTAFNLLHVFIGHNGLISDVEPHKTDALLFSSSHDGTVRLWRLDSMQIFMRLDIGEKIYHLALLSNTEFYFYTEKNIVIYSCNQFYEFFASVESETKRLMCCRGKNRPNRILASTEDGSVRLFSPITGLTLTIIYPMPSFQVLMSFAYDIHQDKLHTVLTGGKVIVYNTATNPCKAEELWVPKCEDEHVNILLLVTVEFQCEDGTDVDNLVFAGLQNGQILLCDAVVCSLEFPVQAHEGAVVCLVSCLHPPDVGHFGSSDTVGVIVSGGTDKYVKIWKVQISLECRRPVITLFQTVKIYLLSVPLHICMYSTNVWVSTQTLSEHGKILWKLALYKLIQMASSRTLTTSSKQLLNRKFVLMAHQVTHPDDEDHTEEMTSLDICPIMNVVLTSGKDGFVKVWNGQNELIREMNFAMPIYASCFANDRGDLLVGFGTHICSVSLVNYLPLDYLKEVSSVPNFCTQDDVRELPVKFDNTSQPWLDICKLSHYSVDIVERRQQRLEEEVIEKLKKATQKQSTKFVIFVDGRTTRVIRKDFADKLLSWAKGKHKLKFDVKTANIASLLAETNSDTVSKTAGSSSTTKKNAALSKRSKADSSLKEETKEYLDSEGLFEIYPSTVGKVLRHLNQQKHLGADEMRLLKEQELLKKDPIIAPDGYIPNSVLRKKIKPRGVDVPIRKPAERPFKLKPVPQVNPQHMPSWWSEEEKEQASSRLEYRVMKWDDTPSPTPRSEISSVSSVSLKSLIESPVKKYIAEGRIKTISPKSPKSKAGVKSRSQSVSKSRNDATPIENMKKMIKANDKNKKAGKFGWDSSSSEKPDSDGVSRSKPTSGLSERQRSSTNLSETSILKPGKGKPGTPTAYKLISPSALMLTPLMKAEACSARSRGSSDNETVKSKRMDLSRLDYDTRTPDSARRGRRSGAQSEAREKSFKLTNYAVDEDSSAIHVKESKSGRRLKSHMSHVIIKQLLEEEWMPELDGDYEFGDVVNNLVTVLDDKNNPVVYDNACTYVNNLFHELGFSEGQMDQIVGKLGVNLDNNNTAIKKYTLRTLQNIGQGRNDVLMLILPKLVDQDETIRRAAVDALRVLTGATDKESLLIQLESVGITSAEYRSKPDEEYTLAMLAEKFGEHEDPETFERIQNWVAGTTPGLYDEDRDDDDLWQDGSRSRKEHSFLSEGKSLIDMYDTSGCNTMYADLPTTPGSYSDNDELIFSRGVSMHDAKSTGLKSEKSRFNARMDLLDRAGASVYPGERFEQPTPLSDLMGNDEGNAEFMTEGSPFMQDPLLNFDQDIVKDFDEEQLSKEKTDISRGSAKSSPKSLDKLLLKERTLTDLSLVGPLPNFLPRDNTGRNFDEISTDSAFESAISVSEYDTSHFSEKWPMSHTDQQSSKHSQLSDENNMFDVEQVSNMDYEGDDAESGIDVNSMKKHEIARSMENKVAYNMENVYINENAGFENVEKSNSMSSSGSDEIESGKISVIITPRGSILGKDSHGSKKDGPLTPRSRGAASTFRKRMKEADGFSTISDRSSSSRKSRGSGRQELYSEQHSMSSADGLKLPYTLPSQARDSVLSKTSSSKSQLKTGKKISPDEDLLFTAEEHADDSVDKSPNDIDTVQVNTENDLEDEAKLVEVGPVEKTKTVGTEPTTVSMDTNTGSIDTQLVSKGTPANSPEVPDWSTQDVPVTIDNIHLEPITEDIENASFFKTPRGADSAIPMESTAIDKIGMGKTKDAHTLSRFTPRDPNLYKYYDTQQDAKQDKQLLKETDSESSRGRIQDRDSGFKTISDITSSQITDRLSGYSSGIGRDMSEFSHGRTFGKGHAHAPLSPVKSESASPPPHLRLHSPKDWRKFFDMIPNAQERRQMEQIRREMEQGKLRHSTLPPISYFAEDLPMLPGEAGTRLLKTVRVGEKVQAPGDGRHRIESVPGKLAVHTQNEDAGLSNFGILQMQWTTGIPTVKDRVHPPQRIPQHRSHKMIRPDSHDHDLNGLPHRMRRGISDEELHLPYLEADSPNVPIPDSRNHYEWEFPLPPPPAKESRTEIPQIKKDHDTYCKYYHLVKKKLHLYTSQQKERTQHLPELFVKRIRDREQPTSGASVKKKRSLTKTDLMSSSVIFPPLKLRQLVNIY